MIFMDNDDSIIEEVSLFDYISLSKISKSIYKLMT